MGDTEIRRVMRVVFNAVELVRDCYGGAAGNSPAKVLLERAGKALWEAQGLLVAEAPERNRKRIRDTSAVLKKLVAPLSRQGHREVAEALSDAADALSAYAVIAQISLEAGLVG